MTVEEYRQQLVEWEKTLSKRRYFDSAKGRLINSYADATIKALGNDIFQVKVDSLDWVGTDIDGKDIFIDDIIETYFGMEKEKRIVRVYGGDKKYLGHEPRVIGNLYENKDIQHQPFYYLETRYFMCKLHPTQTEQECVFCYEKKPNRSV